MYTLQKVASALICSLCRYHSGQSPGSRARLKVFDALSSYLGIMFKHSDTNLDLKKHSQSIYLFNQFIYWFILILFYLFIYFIFLFIYLLFFFGGGERLVAPPSKSATDVIMSYSSPCAMVDSCLISVSLSLSMVCSTGISRPFSLPLG